MAPVPLGSSTPEESGEKIRGKERMELLVCHVRERAVYGGY